MSVEDPDPRELVIELHGEIDASMAVDIESIVTTAQQQRCRSVVLDLSDVAFIDSQGLRELIAAQLALATGGTSLYLRNPSKMVRRVLEISGAGEVIPLTA